MHGHITDTTYCGMCEQMVEPNKSNKILGISFKFQDSAFYTFYTTGVSYLEKQYILLRLLYFKLTFT